MRNLLVTLLILVSSCAWADRLQLGVGGFAISLPAYPGSDERHHHVAPIPYLRYESDSLSIDREGITGHLWHSDRWHLDVSGNAGLPVKSSDNQRRRGMADLDWRFELGPSLQYFFQGQPDDIQQTYAETYVRKAIATDFGTVDDVGWFAGLSLTHQQPLDFSQRGHWIWTTTLDIRSATDKAHQYYYGVRPNEALTERPVFTASGGYWGRQLSSGVVYSRGNWWLAGFARYHDLGGSQSEPSALLQQTRQWSIGVGVAWIFSNKEI